MHSKLSLMILMVAALGLGLASAAAAADPTLAAWWRYDETSGVTAADSSGNGNDGVVMGNPIWGAGQLRGAIRLDGTGDYIEVQPSPSTNVIGSEITATAWVYLENTAGVHIILAKCYNNTTHTSPYFSYGLHVLANGTPRFWISTPNNNQAYAQGAAQLVKANQWHHMTGVYDGAQLRLYLDGAVIATANATGAIREYTTVLRMGTNGGLSEPWIGSLDDIRVYKRVLTEDEIFDVMAGVGSATQTAGNPSPTVEAEDVPFDAPLSWSAGEFAATHDVYLGTALTDVTDADRANPMGVLVSQGQTDPMYETAGLEYGRTYYWRVDEVNAAPDNAIFKGEVWNFTVEPYAYPIAGVTVAASSQQVDMPAVNVVNGSGLDDLDQHGVDSDTMWMATDPMPVSLEFDLQEVYKLDEMWVWNSNQIIESLLGFGAKDVVVEYSTDGATWTALEGVAPFGKATGQKTYAADTMVSFGGAMAQYVRLTISSNWGGIAPQTGLSEVRFFAIPVQAREPQPAVDATNVSVDADLSWRPGREATSHTVYLSPDEQAVADGAAPAEVVTNHGYTPASLDFATTYFWKVDEVGDADTYPGEVWSFTTQQYAPIDDMESYTDEEGSRIYETWIDGYTTKASGSTVGYLQAPFAEKTITHAGGQSMPLLYDNSIAPYYSEAEQVFDTPRNWTTNGADTLSLYFRGVAPGFAQTAAGNILMNGVGADIWGTADQFRYVYKSLNGNGSIVARVESVFQSNAWAKAGVMIRQSTDAGSAHAFMAITPGGTSAGNGASFQRRLTTGGTSTNNDSTTLVGPPYWAKVERVGDAFSAYISSDGATWTQLGAAQTIAMTDPVLIGLAVCSHDAAVATSAEFSNVSASGNVTGAWETAEIGVAQPAGNSAEGVFLTVEDNSGKTKTLAHPDAMATARGGWQQWSIPLSDLTSAGVKTNAVKSITIGVGNRTTPTAGGTGLVFIDDIAYGRAATN